MGTLFSSLKTLKNYDKKNLTKAKDKIQACLRNNGTTLDLSVLGIYDIQKEIPEFLQLTKLISLTLEINQIKDLSPLSHLTNVTELKLRDNQIKDLSPLSHLTNVTNLDLRSNQIKDLSPLSHLTKLTRLYLNFNRMTDLSSLSHLTNVTVLFLRDNQITDLSPLSHLKKLTYLNLERNQITDLSPLSHLTNLTDLYLSFNQIKDLSPLSHLKKLTSLDLSGNQMKDLSPLIPILRQFKDIVYKDGYRANTLINLYNNPLISPPLEIVNLGKEAVIRWLNSQKKHNNVKMFAAKLIFVGEGAAGKTSLLNRLIDPNSKLPEEF